MTWGPGFRLWEPELLHYISDMILVWCETYQQPSDLEELRLEIGLLVFIDGLTDTARRHYSKANKGQPQIQSQGPALNAIFDEYRRWWSQAFATAS